MWGSGQVPWKGLLALRNTNPNTAGSVKAHLGDLRDLGDLGLCQVPVEKHLGSPLPQGPHTLPGNRTLHLLAPPD